MKNVIARVLCAFVLLLVSVTFCQGSSLPYVIHFGAATSGLSGTPTGGFMYNPATNLFESFDVTFAGVSFNLAPAANTPAATLSGFSCFGDRGDAEGFFQSLTGSCGVGTWQYELNSGTHSFRIQFVAAGDILSATATRISVAPGAPAGGPPGSSPTQSSGPLNAATPVSTEVPEPALVLPVALVLGVLVTKRLRPGGSGSARNCGERGV